ncbi:unnamed protein product, partial [Heterotrigona itama]
MWTIRRARYANASSVAYEVIKLMNYGHHAHCLSLIQVAPRHVNEVLAMNMER